MMFKKKELSRYFEMALFYLSAHAFFSLYGAISYLGIQTNRNYAWAILLPFEQIRSFPFFSWLIYPYAITFILTGLILLLSLVVSIQKNQINTYYKCAIYPFLLVLLFYVIYLLFPTMLPQFRQPSVGMLLYLKQNPDSLLQFMLGVSAVGNAFPSMHVGIGWGAVRLYIGVTSNERKRYLSYWLLLSWFGLMFISTLSLGFHVWLDVITALVLADLIWRVITRFEDHIGDYLSGWTFKKKYIILIVVLISSSVTTYIFADYPKYINERDGLYCNNGAPVEKPSLCR